jgi:hypothetical protein
MTLPKRLSKDYSGLEREKSDRKRNRKKKRNEKERKESDDALSPSLFSVSSSPSANKQLIPPHSPLSPSSSLPLEKPRKKKNDEKCKFNSHCYFSSFLASAVGRRNGCTATRCDI